MKSKSTSLQGRIQQMSEGAIFTFSSIADSSISPQALAVIVSRLAKRGIIQRLSRGRYTKARESRYGAILPPDSDVLESILRPDGKQVMAYISGLTAYNRMGLTTQVATGTLVVSASSSRSARVGKLSLRYVRTNAPITEETALLLPVLDALRDIKKIPDASPSDTIEKVRSIVRDLKVKDKKLLADLAQYYAPRVRALVGAIFDTIGEKTLANRQRKSLNPISTYSIGLNKKMLPSAERWSIR